MGQLMLLNPIKRRRHRVKSRKAPSAAQIRARAKFAAMARSRSRMRRRAPITIANPVRRKVRRAAPIARKMRRTAHRIRSGLSSARFGFSAGAILKNVQNAAVGGAGAVAVDMAMAQAARVLPESLTSRYNSEGGINWSYYGTKILLATAAGVFGSRILPGRAKAFAVQGAQGSITVQAYEILRTFVPPSQLGFYSPARIAGIRSSTPARLGAYTPARAAVMPIRQTANADIR